MTSILCNLALVCDLEYSTLTAGGWLSSTLVWSLCGQCGFHLYGPQSGPVPWEVLTG
jgi:hypothetical protein